MKNYSFYFEENDIFIAVQKTKEIYLNVAAFQLKNVLYDLKGEMR